MQVTLQPAGGVFMPDQVQTEFQALLLKLQLHFRVRLKRLLLRLTSISHISAAVR